MSFFQPLVVFIIALSLLVLVHEWGHYWVARRAGVRVLRFSIGFGPEIVGFTRGDTRWSICGIPFGGYVKFAGDNPEEERDNVSDEFLSQSVGVRSAIVLAGPVMNYLLAIVLFATVLYFQGVPVLPGTRVGTVMEDSTAEAIGVLPNDEITDVNGTAVGDWLEFSETLGAIGEGESFELRVMRDGEVLQLEGMAPADGGFATAPLGVSYRIDPKTGSVKRGGPAWQAGLRKGDLVKSIDGLPVDRWSRLVELIQERPEREVAVVFEREGTELETVVTPAPFATSDAAGEPLTIGRIGIEPGTEFERSGIGAAIAGGWGRTWWLTTEVLKLLPQVPVKVGKGLLGLVRGDRAEDEGLGGPVRIAQLFGEAAAWGLFHFLALTASISTQLAIFNLLPIPVLDGGHLALYFVEVVTRRPPSLRVRIALQQLGFGLLILLMLSVTVMDIGRFFG